MNPPGPDGIVQKMTSSERLFDCASGLGKYSAAQIYGKDVMKRSRVSENRTITIVGP